MSRVKRRNHSAQMNIILWCSDSENTCIIEENILDPNIRIKQLLSTEKTGHSEVGNFIIVNFEQISKMFMKLKCPDCDKQTLKLALGNKVGFSYVSNLTCSCCVEKVCAVETSNERQGNTVPDINLRITQAFSNIGKGYSAIEKFCYVIDFEVNCKVCRNCSTAKRELGESSAEYDIWFEGHRKDCDINHSGSSTSMEMEAALILWERSQEMRFR
ncbi:uncharacterized protein TNCV_2085541 [Trichonephila clavipes]|nr:uncharacterized protein TNCV_2085541 [Trichonephila clavipes]